MVNCDFSDRLWFILASRCNEILQGVNDVQTEADRRVQHCILASLNKLFPKVAVIAEEVNACAAIANVVLPVVWCCNLLPALYLMY